MPHRRVVVCVLLLLSGLVPARIAFAADACAVSPVVVTRSGAVATVEVNFELLKACIDAEQTPNGRLSVRIDEDTYVRTKVTHFNFVNYSLAYQVEETVVDTYVNLMTLWTQLVGLPLGIAQPLAPTADQCGTFASCVGQWAYDILRANQTLNDYLRTFQDHVSLGDSEVALTVTHYSAMRTLVDGIKERLDDINKRQPPVTLEDVDKLTRVYATQVALLGRIDAFGAAADLVQHGEIRNVGKKKGGTIVAITITPKALTQATVSPVAQVEYFTHSRLPVIFHAGYAYSKLTDVKVDTVRSLEQADLFSVVRQNSSTNAMVAFLSLGQTVREGQFGVFGTIGTDFTEPGERVYLGVSVNAIKRLFITAGLVSGTQQEPHNPVTEKVGNSLNARELFAAIDPQRRWRGFGAVSFRVF